MLLTKNKNFKISFSLKKFRNANSIATFFIIKNICELIIYNSISLLASYFLKKYICIKKRLMYQKGK